MRRALDHVIARTEAKRREVAINLDWGLKPPVPLGWKQDRIWRHGW
ncbi:hypothetical protein KQI63_05225 [bacterium]|nr:hypothetical protein [bacterium]